MKFPGILAASTLLLSCVLRAAQNPVKAPKECQAGDRALAAKSFELARSEYEKCLSQGEPRFETLSNLGIVYAQLNLFDQAIKAYTQALALKPDSAPVYVNLGLAYMKTDRNGFAAKEFARALMDDPENLQALELLAICHFQLDQYELAAEEAYRVLKAKPDDASAAFLLGSAYLRLGLYKRAIALIYYSVQESNAPEGRVILGEAFMGVRSFQQALEQFQKAAALAPDLPGIHAELGTAYAGLAQPDKAMAEFEKELARDPESFGANYYLGRLKRLAHDRGEAQKYLEKAEKLRPGTPSVQYEYAVMATEDKDYARAESLLKGIIQRYPDNTEAHILLAELYFKTHRTQDGAREQALVQVMKKNEQAAAEAESKARQQSLRGKPSPGSAPRP